MRRQIGRLGETFAARFLIDRGATIIARNLRHGRDEIDLVVHMDGRVVLVEVKTRIDADPLEDFDERQLTRIRSAAGGHRLPSDRIDLVGVRLSERGVGVRWLASVG